MSFFNEKIFNVGFMFSFEKAGFFFFSDLLFYDNSFLASGDFWRLLIMFANSLDQVRTDKMSVLIWIQTV